MIRNIYKKAINRSIIPPLIEAKTSFLFSRQLATIDSHSPRNHREKGYVLLFSLFEYLIENLIFTLTEYNKVTLIGTIDYKVFENEKSTNFLLATQHQYQ